mgnify:CR=1 FL=1
MAKKQTKGIEPFQWKPGQSGNKAGKPKNLLTKDRVKHLISKFSQLTEAELKEIAADPKSKWESKCLAHQMLAAQGDIAALNFVLDRSIGKVKDVTEITLPKPTVVEKLDGTTMILAAEMPALEGEVVEVDE